MIFDILHSFVNIFAGGRSEIKAILFILYLLLLSAIYLDFRKLSLRTFRWQWFGLSLLAMYLYGLGLHVFHALSNKLPLTTFFVTGHNGEISCSSLWHTHVAKATIAQIAAYFGKTKFQATDAGGAYLGLVPNWLFLLGSVLLIALLLQAFLYFATAFCKLLHDREKNTRQRCFLILGYALISFSLIKTALDGGVFNRSFIIGLIFIAIFTLRERKSPLVRHYYIIGPIISAAFLTINFLNYGGHGAIAAPAALLLLYTLVLYGSEKKIKSWILLLLFAFFMAGWWVFSIGDREIRAYSSTVLPVGSQAYFYDENEEKVKIIEMERSQSVGQLARSLRKNVNYLPLAANGVNCAKDRPRPKFSITLITPKPLDANAFASTGDIRIINQASSGSGTRWRTDLRVLLNPCLLETLTIINGELHKNNVDDYLLINPIFYGTADTY